VLAHDGAILRFGQRVVVAVPRPRLGELDVDLVEQLGDLIIDVLTAVVRVKATHGEREAVEQGAQHRQEVVLADALDRGDELELGDGIDGVDQVDALEAIQVALMHAVDADEAGAALGLWSAPFTDRPLHRPCLVRHRAART
jgi:hypothetical protein